MLTFLLELILILSVLIRFIILKGILTYNKEGKQNKEIVFYILLLLIYIMARLCNIGQISGNNANNFIDIIVFIIWGIYYIHFYKIKPIRYIISFYLFNIYYDLCDQVLGRALFIGITGYSQSSEGMHLVSIIEDKKILVYSYILIFVIYILIKNINNKLQIFDIEKRSYIYLVIALFVNSINIIGRYIFGIYNIGSNSNINQILHKWRLSVPMLYDEWGYFDQIVTPKLAGVSIIIIILLFKRTIEENKIKYENRLIENKLDMQYTYYLNIQENNMKVRALYHDINNHIYCINNLNNDNKKINEYVSSLKDEIKEFEFIYDTGNMILDIIINEKSKLCRNKGIKFTCNIDFSMVKFVKPTDVSSIFSNVLDNAIEACDKINDENINKYIKVKGTMTKAFFVLKCENSKVNDVRFQKGRMLTDKADNFIHGMGIQSIKLSIKKYNGEVLFEDCKEKFILKIYIPLEQDVV